MLRMKGHFSRLQICDQLLDPINRDLIANRQEHSPVMFDPFVAFVAFVAHGNPLEPRTEATIIGLPDGKYGWNGNLFTGLWCTTKSPVRKIAFRSGAKSWR